MPVVTLNPNVDVLNEWQVKPTASNAAFSVVDDGIAQPNSVPATDWLWAGAAGKVVELGLSSTTVTHDDGVRDAKLWFYCNTGPSTQLKAEVLWNGLVKGTVTVPANSSFGWKSLTLPSTPARQADVDSMSIRFTSLGGADTNVRAAYVEIDKIPLHKVGNAGSLTWDDPADQTIPAAAPPGYNKQWQTPYGFTLLTAAGLPRAGDVAARCELRRSDPDQNLSKRSELTTSIEDVDGAERWYGISMNLRSTSWQIDPQSAEVLWQWHQKSDTGGSPPLSVGTRNGLWEVHVNGLAVPLLGTGHAYQTDVWTDWVVHAKWSHTNTGFYEVWRNGTLVYTKYNAPTKPNDGTGVYPKLGIYKWDWKSNPTRSIVDTRVVFYDEFRMGDANANYKVVAPR
jgi:hypothetical protein